MKALNKDILKEIEKSKGRFVSILLMVGMGVLIFVGLKITGPIMEKRADDYLAHSNTADIIVKSTYGLEEEDISLIKQSPQLDELEIGYIYDLETESKDDLIRINSITNDINILQILEGKLPVKTNEIVLDRNAKDRYKIGDTIEFIKDKKEDEDKYALNNYKFKVVGFVNSSDYIDTLNMGSSSKGDGIVTSFGFILEENFNLEKYSIAKITFKDLENLDFTDNKYRKIAKERRKEIEDLLSPRKEEVFNKLKNEIKEKILEGEKELLDAKTEIQNGERKITEGKIEISKGYINYNNGKVKLQKEILEGEKKLLLAQQELNSQNILLNEKKVELAKAELQLIQAKSELDLGRAKLDAAWAQLLSQEQLLNLAIGGYKLQIQILEETLKQIESGTSDISQFNNIEDVYFQENLEDLNLSVEGAELSYLDYLNNWEIPKLNEDFKIPGLDLEKTKEKIEEELVKSREALNKAEGQLPAIIEGKKELEKQESNWQEGNTKYEMSYNEFMQGKIQIAEGEKAVVEGQSQIDKGHLELKTGQIEGEASLEAGARKLKENEELLKENEEKFNQEKEKAEKEIVKAEEELDNARRFLSTLIEPSYEILSKETNISIFSFYDQASRLNIISNIFPVFFFFIALLVSLTTMTRMVDEDRLVVGTLKALGYSNINIVKKYFIYGGIASLAGGSLGIILGHKLIAPLIFKAYASNYVFDYTNIPLNIGYSFTALTIGVICTGLAGVMASWGSLRENTATLLRGKPPRKGTRIFIERIKFIWNKLNFMQKVTMRNIFRYKRRMFMTIIGIAGCTGLIFMGFGIKDSITNLEKKQYGELFKFDIISIYNEDLSPIGHEAYKEILKDKSKVKAYSSLYINNYKAERKIGPDQNITIISPTDSKELKEYITIRNRKTQNKLELTDNGIIITEKISKILELDKGDFITVKDANNIKYKLKIVEIAENYTGNYIYMTPEYYQKIFQKEYKANGNIIKINSEDTESRKEIIEEINDNKSIMSIYNNGQSQKFISALMSTLNILVLVIIVCSSILAFVVLYNLTNINVSERIRELSTIKVLGFYDKEVTAYVYRETLLLTLFGIIVGYILGFIMHYIIINRLIPDDAMLDPHLYLLNYLLSGILTMIFAILVMYVVHRKLKQINMVEALKAIE